MFSTILCSLSRRLALLIAAAFAASVAAEPIKLNLYTQEFPPLQVQIDHRPEGYVVKFVEAIVEQAAKSLPMEIEAVHFVPWKRAIRITQRDENSLFFSISRTPEREGQYHWIGEVSPYEVGLYRYKDGPDVLPIDLDELVDFRFATQAESSFEELLLKLGMTNRIPVEQGKDVIRLLRADRVDFAPLVTASYYYRMEQYGFDPNNFVEVMKVRQLCKELWLVTGKKTSPQVVKALKESFLLLREQGLREQLISQYQPNSDVMANYRHLQKQR
ncbi:amino acid ABC transporter periplasmic protein [Vibrio sinaloensis DSM 21326]|uniref:Amino acid ABC transporter periplasmic protein n=1 Tax=Vibrio sinaloensis DSM 21326 TaxID=945550 RepID=E8M4B7_PHOS4|nr:transporter substrate-binding domain-containing protein [Vibrio sinaloensis]EGA71155.1 amino acid ABC transporter periplasmic protein [Vibrio sinaloensis DSM 21326]